MKKLGISLIKAKEADKDFLLDLRKQTMVGHLEKAGIYLSNQEHIARIQKSFEGSYLISTSRDKVGLLKYVADHNRIEILQLQIAPKFQGKGIGKQVLHMMILKAKSVNKILFLKVLKENPAKYLYERIGFKIVDEDDYEFYMEMSSKK